MRNAKGERVRDNSAGGDGTGRNIDFVVKGKDGKWRPVEVTSKTADKAAQLNKEKAIRNQGGTFVRLPGSKVLVLSMAMKDPRIDARKQLELAEYLLQNGLSPNRKDRNPKLGLTPLIKAVIYDKPALVEIFKKYGGDPHLTANSGKSAIDYAKSMNRMEILQILETN
mgnify:CR=1 FL=1